MVDLYSDIERGITILNARHQVPTVSCLSEFTGFEVSSVDINLLLHLLDDFLECYWISTQDEPLLALNFKNDIDEDLLKEEESILKDTT